MPKLVRDRIPDPFPADTYRMLDEAEYESALRDKLTEEGQEYLTDRTAEELADVLEVLHALSALHNLDPDKLKELQTRKAAEWGGFVGAGLVGGTRDLQGT
ncbi:nucleoside triphosphate pyrophosphohydrolase [Deinococcus apachensis]|uniref:nucleoside triphosphate pyrophosphohydrolase n=1 Tax=Deinococcus apachensis TaxID=309886 RepID=UPI00036A32E9|nr:nucleoside triphosphate pyrophosphohydrolase [Deinococcus apachensis]